MAALSIILAILKYLLYAVLALLAVIELNQIRQLYKRYKQGMDVMYFPVIGFLFYQKCRKKNKDTARWMKERVSRNDLNGKKATAMNFPLLTKPLVFIQDPEMISDIFSREMDICFRKDMNEGVGLFNFGNFYDYSERALVIRGAFTEVFRTENLDSMVPKIDKAVNELIDSLEEEEGNKQQLDSKGFMDVDLRENISEMFVRILEKFLFGMGSSTLVEGKPLVNQIVSVFHQIADLMTKPKTYLSLGMNIVTRLDPQVREIDRMSELINKKIIELYNEKKDDPNVSQKDFLGGVIHYNRKHPEEPLTEKEIIGNVMLMVFAAFDPSKYTAGWGMRFLSLSQKDQQILREEAEKVGTFDGELTGEKLEAGRELNAWIKETIRLGTPLPFSDVREFTKNTKVKGVEFKKGDMISFSLLWNHFKETDFPDPFEFDRTRHYKAKYHRNNLMPFGGGKRGCIGMYLAVMIIKIIILNFMRRFSVENDPSFDSQNWHFPFHTLDKWLVRLRKL